MPYQPPDPPSSSNPEEYRYCRLRFQPKDVLVEDYEPSRYVQEWRGRLEWVDPHVEANTISLGTFSVYVVDLTGAAIDGQSFFDVFDTHQSTMDVFNALFDPRTHELTHKVTSVACGTDLPQSEGLLIINRIAVLPEHRGHLMGLMMIKRLIEQFRGGAGIVALKVFPLQFEHSAFAEGAHDIPRASLKLNDFKLSITRSTAKLMRHYAQLGFRQIGSTEYMVLDAGRKLPTFDEISARPA